MKAILMSIKPQWVSKILNGEKTIEIRKRFPKDYVGWVYIYCTKNGALLFKECSTNTYWAEEENKTYRPNYALNGKVVARFWCDRVEYCEDTNILNDEDYDLEDSCLTSKEIQTYGKQVYAIHITNLEIFDRPKEISEFYLAFSYVGGKPFKNTYTNSLVHRVEINGEIEYESVSHLTRAPQSYMFIEI